MYSFWEKLVINEQYFDFPYCWMNYMISLFINKLKSKEIL